MAHYDIGFLGGGQLARMSIQAAQRMGLTCLSLDPGEAGPAAQVADAIVGRLDDVEAIGQILDACDRVTLENEFIPAEAIRRALDHRPERSTALVPSLESLATIQDKLRQRQAYERAGVPSPKAVEMEAEPIGEIGFPMVLKARFGGYDGKGTRYARTLEELEALRSTWENQGWLAESFVPFRREVAVMVCASRTETVCYPTMETIQRNHVCDLVFPAGSDAAEVAVAAVRSLGGIGLYGVELFELEDGTFQVNEIAPRPHNTGHYSMDFGATSQFEQHIRLVMGWPLGSVNGGEACMANLLGREGLVDFRAGAAAAIGVPGVHFHWYGKAELKPGRKLGHINAVGPSARERAEEARDRFYVAASAG